MNDNYSLDGIVEVINKANSICIFGHIAPDGDAVGSCLGMYLGLKQLKKDVSVVLDDFSKCFNFLPATEEVNSNIKKNYDLGIALDCATRSRLYDKDGLFDKCDVSVVIDHHSSNTYFGNYNYVEGDSPAVCKTLVKILKKLNISIDKEIGDCLMAGIITDSGGFRYKTVDAETFEIAASMLNIGVDISDIYYRTFDLKSKACFDLTNIANSRLKFYSKGLIAVTYITRDDFKKTKANVGDHEGIVNIGRNIDGVEVSIFLREEEDGSYKVSLRSNSYVDVSEVGKAFDGGGHYRASGCTMNVDLEEAIRLLVREVNKRL